MYADKFGKSLVGKVVYKFKSGRKIVTGYLDINSEYRGVNDKLKEKFKDFTTEIDYNDLIHYQNEAYLRDHVFERPELDKKLEEWKITYEDKNFPLIIQGTEKVGKKTLLRKFAIRNFKQVCIVDFNICRAKYPRMIELLRIEHVDFISSVNSYLEKQGFIRMRNNNDCILIIENLDNNALINELVKLSEDSNFRIAATFNIKSEIRNKKVYGIEVNSLSYNEFRYNTGLSKEIYKNIGGYPGVIVDYLRNGYNKNKLYEIIEPMLNYFKLVRLSVYCEQVFVDMCSIIMEEMMHDELYKDWIGELTVDSCQGYSDHDTEYLECIKELFYYYGITDEKCEYFMDCGIITLIEDLKNEYFNYLTQRKIIAINLCIDKIRERTFEFREKV